VLGCEGKKNAVTALVDTDDIHALASGMSFLCTDTKGDLFRNYAGIAKDCYGLAASGSPNSDNCV